MFMKDLSAIVRHMRTYAEQSLLEYNLGFPEQLVLMFMSARDGACNQESIARYVDIDKGAVAKTLNKLEAKGLVTRTVNAANKREKLVELTDEAHSALHAMSDHYSRWAETAFAGISDDDLALFQSVVARIAENSSSLTTPEACLPSSPSKRTDT